MSVYNITKRKKNNFFLRLNLTSKIILINAIFFIIAYPLIMYSNSFLAYIALSPRNIVELGYYWTFITSMFMHGGFFHLFLNMMSLFFVGNLIEKILGQKRLLRFYIVSGIFSGFLFLVSSLVLSSDYSTYAVGASGAIFGLVGLMMILTPNLKVYIMPIPAPIKIKYAAIGMLFLLWIISFAANIPIGNVAHLGGFICGIIYGLYLRHKFPTKIKMISKHFS